MPSDESDDDLVMSGGQGPAPARLGGDDDDAVMVAGVGLALLLPPARRVGHAGHARPLQKSGCFLAILCAGTLIPSAKLPLLAASCAPGGSVLAHGFALVKWKLFERAEILDRDAARNCVGFLEYTLDTLYMFQQPHALPDIQQFIDDPLGGLMNFGVQVHYETSRCGRP